jgi:hypothetical protein
MVKVLGIQEPFGVRIQKKFGKPWENILLQSDHLLLENGNFLLFERGGKIYLEADKLLFETSDYFRLEAGRPEFLLFQNIGFLFAENGSKIVLNYPYGHSSFGIYRLTNCREGKISTRRKFYKYYTDCTPARRLLRLKYTNAQAGWRSLTTEQKAVYNKRAVGRHYSGYNLFIKEFMKN